MIRAFLPGPGKNGSVGLLFPTRMAWGSLLRLVWRILSFSLETEEVTLEEKADLTGEEVRTGAAANVKIPTSSTHLTSSP